ncbi:MAG: hypothetical protein ACK5NB_14030 [Flavobacteriaceae bacterium]
MLVTLLLIVFGLVGVNFLLLFLSCNKTNRKNSLKKPPIVLHPSIAPKRLAATGS